MKKILLSSIALFFICAVVKAQESKTQNNRQNSLALTAGPAFPLADFSSTDLNNKTAGMANTGFTLELKYARQFNNAFGFAISGLYGHHSTDKKLLNESGATVGPWEYTGGLIGPFIMTSVSPNVNFDLSAMTGAVSTILRDKSGQDDWRTAMPLRVSADFRFHLAKAVFLSAGANYLYMRPKFKASISDGNVDLHKTINTIGANAGIGFSF